MPYADFLDSKFAMSALLESMFVIMEQPSTKPYVLRTKKKLLFRDVQDQLLLDNSLRKFPETEIQALGPV